MKIVSMVYDKLKKYGMFIKDLVLKSIEDDVPGLSAQLAFFLVLSFFPFLTLLFSLISLSPFLTEDMLFDVLKALPDESVSLVWDIITGVAKSKGIIITSALVAIWSVSAAIGTVAKAINRFYHIKEKRNIFVVRLKGMFYVAVTVFLIIAGFSAVVFGSLIGQGIAWLFPWFTHWWNVIRLVLLLLCALSIFIVIFKKMPAKDVKVTYLWQGALFTSVGWGVGSYLFSFYVNHFSNYHVLYGGLAGVIALVFWLYMSAYIILIGAEINSIIYKRYIEREK